MINIYLHISVIKLLNYYLKNTPVSASIIYVVSFTPAVSYAECIASCASPISTVLTDTCELDILPSVEPPAISDLLAYVWYGTFLLSHMSLNMA